ncbi:hypothetical protein OSTOST_15643 [Ostertagia ostertagi]
MGLMSEKLGTLTQRLVHPTAPVLLTKNGPLGARVRVTQFNKETETTYPIESRFDPKSSNHSLYRYNRDELQLSWGNFGDQLLDGSISLSPYTQVYRSICTSEPIRTSIRVSSDFVLLRHSSPSFGSQPVRSTAAHLHADKTGPWCATSKSNPMSAGCTFKQPDSKI